MTGLALITTVLTAFFICINGVESSVRLRRLDVNRLLQGNRDLSSDEDVHGNRRPRHQERGESQHRLLQQLQYLQDEVQRLRNNYNRNDNNGDRSVDHNRQFHDRERNQHYRQEVNHRNHNHEDHRHEQQQHNQRNDNNGDRSIDHNQQYHDRERNLHYRHEVDHRNRNHEDHRHKQQQHNENALENILSQTLNLDHQQNKRQRNQLRPNRLLGSNEKESLELDQVNNNNNYNKYSKIYVLLNPSGNNGNKNKLNEMLSHLLKLLQQDDYYQKNYGQVERYKSRRLYRDDDGRDGQDDDHVRRPRNREYQGGEGPAAGRTQVPHAGLRNNKYERN